MLLCDLLMQAASSASRHGRVGHGELPPPAGRPGLGRFAWPQPDGDTVVAVFSASMLVLARLASLSLRSSQLPALELR